MNRIEIGGSESLVAIGEMKQTNRRKRKRVNRLRKPGIGG